MGRGLSNSEVADVYRRYGHLMRRRSRVMLRHEPSADRAVQETFIKLMRYGAELREADARLRWIYRVIDRCCFDALGHLEGLEQERETDGGAGTAHPSVAPEVRDAVLATLHELTDPERTLAVWRFVDGEGEAEIAAEIDWSRRAVSRRLQDLGQRMEDQGGVKTADGAPAEAEHPSPMRLEAWSVGEPDPGVDQHVGDCKGCRDYVVSLEMEKEVFLDQEEPETFVPRVRRVADTQQVPVVGLAQPKPAPEPKVDPGPEPAPEPAPEPESADQPERDATSSSAPSSGGVQPAADRSWLARKRWLLVGPALALVAVVAVRMHAPDPAQGPTSKPRSAPRPRSALDPEEVIRLKGPIKLGAVVMGVDGKQTRVRGMVYTTAGIKVSVELTVPGAMSITVGVVDDSGEWIPLVKDKQYEAGVHLLPSDLAFDGRPSTVRVMA